jgi:hypothetical protein
LVAGENTICDIGKKKLLHKVKKKVVQAGTLEVVGCVLEACILLR